MACETQIIKALNNRVKSIIKIFPEATTEDEMIIIKNHVNNIFNEKVLTFTVKDNKFLWETNFSQYLINKEYNKLIEEENIYFDIEKEEKMIIPEYDVYIKLKHHQIKTIKRKISMLNRDINNSKYFSKEDLKEMETQKEKLVELLSNFKEQIENLENFPKIEVIKYYFDQDILRIEQLAESNIPEDVQEAKLAIEFYSELLNPEKSFFFSKENIQDKENFAKIREVFEKYVNKALELKADIEIKENDFLKKIIKEGSGFADNIETRIANELIKAKTEGLSDINALTMYLQDPKFQIGINSVNSLHAQVAGVFLEDKINEYNVHNQNFINQIEEIESDLVEQLKKDKVGFDIFFEKDKEGLKTGKFISRFNTSLEERNEKYKYWKNNIKNIFKFIDVKKRNYSLTEIKKQMFFWHKERFSFLEIEKIPELAEEFPNLIHYNADIEYKNKLIKMLGQSYYDEIVEKQKGLLRKYLARVSKITTELEAKVKTGEITETEKIDKLAFFTEKHNPLKVLEQIKKNKPPNILNYQKDLFIEMIPRKTLSKFKDDKWVSTNENTNYYNKDFKKIENNEIYNKFYNLYMEFYKDIDSSLPSEHKKDFDIFKLPALEKTIKEILLDSNLSFMQRFSLALKLLLKKFRDLFRYQDENLIGIKNPLTGEVEDKISLKGLKVLDENSSLIYKKLLEKLNSNEYDDPSPTLDSYKTKVQKILLEALGYSKNELKKLDISSEILKYFSAEDLKKRTAENLLKKAVISNHIDTFGSTDLIKILKISSHALSLYKARSEILPLQKIIKKDYEKVKTKEGKVRHNALKQYESWYNRAVLGKYNKEKGTKKKKREIESLVKKVGLDKKISKKNLEKLVKLGKKLEIDDFSLTSAIENIFFKFIRFKALGYNVSSAMTNFAEGQISNMINASSERYFPEEYYWKAVGITRFSVIRNYSFSLIRHNTTPALKNKFLEAELARKLMDNYNILEDAYNELQKSSIHQIELKEDFSDLSGTTVKHRISKTLNRLSNQKELTSRVEYANQVPIMIAVMMDTIIKGKDGKESSLWDAMLAGAKEGKALGKLGENFDTAENKVNYEILSSKELDSIMRENKGKIKVNRAFLGRITDTIVKFHGDYNPLRGNIASESLGGKALLMFKRWIGSLLYTLFAPEQLNIRTGNIEKGRIRSLDTASGSMYFGLIGLLTLGPVGGLIGGGTGALLGNASWFKAKDSKSDLPSLNIIQDISLLTTMLIKRSIGMPVNLAFGKQVITANKFKKDSKLDKWNERYFSQYTKQDGENIKSNLTSMAILLWATGMYFLMKGLAAGDDEDENEGYYTVASNKFLQLSDQAITMTNPTKLWKNFLNSDSIASLRFLSNVTKTIDLYLHKEEDAKKQEKYDKQFNKTFKPSPLKDYFGFGSQMDRVFFDEPFGGYFDDSFKSDTELAKDKIKNIRQDYRQELIDLEKYTKKEIESMVRKKFSNKKENKSYIEQLKSFEEKED